MTAPDRRPSMSGSAPNRLDADTSHAPDTPDALDRWLESSVARSRRPIAALNGHANGQGAGPRESLGDMSPLVATAREFRVRIEDAERQHGPAVPETEIWERIMNDRLSLPRPSLTPPAPVTAREARATVALPVPRLAASDAPRKRSAVMNVLTGTHPAVSFLLAAAVALAILAVFRSFPETGTVPVIPSVAVTDSGGSGSASNTLLPASGSNPDLVFQSAATPGTPVTSDDCGFAALEFGNGSRLLTDYTPSATVAEPGTLDRVNDALAEAVECSNDEVTLEDFVDLTDPNPETSEEVVRFVRDHWNVDSRRFAGSTLDSSTRNTLRSADATTWIVDPATVVALPDGRTGAFVYVKDKSSTPSELGIPLFARVVIFAPLPNGAADDLVLDEIFLPCTANLQCDAAIIDERVESTPANGEVGVPPVLAIEAPGPAPAVASPEASPVTEPPVPTSFPAIPAASPEAGTPRAVLPTDGTLLIDTGPDSGIVTRPLDGSLGTALDSPTQTGPLTYTRTSVPDVVIGANGKTAINVRTGQVLGMDQYEDTFVSGPFWVQYTSQNPAVPVDARIVDLRTMATAGFFDLAGVSPAGLSPAWLIEGTESGTLGVGVIDNAQATGPAFTPTLLLIDGDLERTRAVPLWSPPRTDGDVLAFSPDGSLVAYLTGTAGDVAIQVETISGAPIQRVPWPGDRPIDHMALTDNQRLVIMSEGGVSRVDFTASSTPAPIATYSDDEVWDAVVSPDGSRLLFATLDPERGSIGLRETAWHLLDIGTGDVTPIPEAAGSTRIGVGQSIEATNAMLFVPIGSLADGTYRVLFVDVTSGAVTAAQPTGVTSGPASGEPISEDGAVIATYGSGSPGAPRFRVADTLGSFPLNGQLSVFDAASRSVATIPMPDIPATEIEPSLIVSPDGRHLVLSVRWTDAGGEHAQSWLTTTDGASGWTPIDGGLVIQWIDG